MIVEFQFETPLLQTAVHEASVGEVAIEQLDAPGSIPLRTVCWLENGHAASFEAGLEADRTVEGATPVVDTDHGQQYDVKYDQQYAGAETYYAAVEEDGIFISGVRRPTHWEVQMRFPDREAFRAFQDSVDSVDLSIQSIHDQESEPRAERYGISEPQREILRLASAHGYFDVPRKASLSDLADELDVSSQAASERLRRGLDSLVEHALLTPE